MNYSEQSLTRVLPPCRALLTVLTIVISVPSYAADPSRTHMQGKADYMEHCASCHGLRGEGDGAVAQFLTIETPDLTLLSQANRGVFPKDVVYSVIDGRIELMVHGPRAMPVWGKVFRDMETQNANKPPERDVIARIDDLIGYIETLQD